LEPWHSIEKSGEPSDAAWRSGGFDGLTRQGQGKTLDFSAVWRLRPSAGMAEAVWFVIQAERPGASFLQNVSSPSVIFCFNTISGSQNGFLSTVTEALPSTKENSPMTP
jgi:hypothetical protein